MGDNPYTRRTKPGWVRVVRAHDLRTRIQLRSRGSWTCYILKIILSFGANSELLSEVTYEPGLEMIPEHLTSKLLPSTWTRSDLGVDPEHLDSRSS